MSAFGGRGRGLFRRYSRDALETIVSTYERQLLAYVTRITGNPSLSEDIVQEVFIKLASHWRERLEPGPLISAWLYKVAHHGAIDVLRREQRQRALHEAHAKERGETEPPSEGQGGRVLSAGAERVREAFARVLTERERSLVSLKIYEELTYQQIAEITGLSQSNVGFILHKAMKKLAAELQKGGH